LNRKRSSDMIISQILDVCAGGASKTEVVYQSNLNFTTVNPYLDLLINRGLLEASTGRRPIYRTTEQGLEFMRSFKHHQGEISRLCDLIENAPSEEMIRPGTDALSQQPRI